MAVQSHPRHPARRAFTLVELLVVVSILLLAVLVFATFAGSVLLGPSIQRQAASINGMAISLRQAAATRQVHVEMVFDYRRDQVIALSRRRLVTFAFEGGGSSGFTVGSGNVIANASNGATVQTDNTLNRRDGDCLELGSAAARFSVPWLDRFDTQGEYEGMALTFDFCALDPLPTDGATLLRMGGAIQLNVAETRSNALRLNLSCGGVTVQGDTWIAANRWATVEVAVSAYGVTLYVDGRGSSAELPEGFKPPPIRGASLELGGVPCRVDNLDVMGLVAGQVLQLDGSHLIAPEVDPMLEVTMQAEKIYDVEPEPSGPVTGPGAEDIPAVVQGLPRFPPPPMVHVYYDGSGRLDPARHPGAVKICLVSGETSDLTRIELTFHPLGTVTVETVERFAWEAGQNGQ